MAEKQATTTGSNLAEGDTKMENKLLKACAEYRKRLDEAELRISNLEAALAEANATIESVCCGEGLTCDKCGKQRPCLCYDTVGR